MNNVKDIKDSINTTYYLNRYPDLKNAFGDNRRKAKTHFINNGVYEKRYFNLPYEEVRNGIAKNKSSDGNVYPYSNNYVKFTNMTTDPNKTTLIDSKTLLTEDKCLNLCSKNSNCGGITYDNNKSNCKIWDMDVYPKADMNRAIKQDFYMRLRELKQYCDDECMKTKKIDRLEKQFDDMYENTQLLPEKFQELTKKLIVTREGETFYNEVQKQRFEEESSMIIGTVKQEYSKIYDFKMELLNSFIKKIDYYNLLRQDKVNQDILHLKELIIEKNNEKNIDARKSYYEEQETKNVNFYTDYFLFFYYSVFLVYMYLFIKNGKYTNYKQLILPILLFLAPYLLFYYVLYYLRTFYDYLMEKMPRNVYFKKQE